MHRIDKFLAQLNPARREKVVAIAKRVRAGDFAGLDMKKLSGTLDQYRVRLGNIRIKFFMNDEGIVIFYIGYRDDHTY